MTRYGAGADTFADSGLPADTRRRFGLADARSCLLYLGRERPLLVGLRNDGEAPLEARLELRASWREEGGAKRYDFEPLTLVVEAGARAWRALERPAGVPDGALLQLWSDCAGLRPSRLHLPHGEDRGLREIDWLLQHLDEAALALLD